MVAKGGAKLISDKAVKLMKKKLLKGYINYAKSSRGRNINWC